MYSIYYNIYICKLQFVKGMDLSIHLYTHTHVYIYNTYLCVCAPVYVYVHHCYTTIPRFFNIFYDIHSQMSGLSGFWYIARWPWMTLSVAQDQGQAILEPRNERGSLDKSGFRVWIGFESATMYNSCSTTTTTHEDSAGKQSDCCNTWPFLRKEWSLR